ncbi:hypothetical protein AB0M68_09695 [Streptomyces sp. NPDC051453]|uniref:hypothetical protein n=1 Tax=Streptomyces sp. NPDC051453 TaxID=3154941 RepID=UPI00342B677E
MSAPRFGVVRAQEQRLHPPVPASFVLGEGERRGRPGRVVDRGPHVVGAAQEPGRRAGLRGPVPQDGVAAVRGLGEMDVAQTRLAERVRDPPRRLAALLGRVAAGGR